MDRMQDKDSFIRCPVCNREMKMKNLSRHLRREHTNDGVVMEYKPIARKADAKARRAFRKANDKKIASHHSLQDMSPAQRRRYLDSLDRPDRERSSDVMDSGRIYNGGGYGLGRSRKH